MKFLDKVGLTYWTSKLKSYVNTKIEDLKNLLSKDIEKKQDKLTAGDNIIITNNTISATDTESIVDLGSFDNQEKLITHVVMNQLPTGYYSFIMNGYPHFMLLEQRSTFYGGTIQASDAIFHYFEVTKTGEIQALITINLEDLELKADKTYVDSKVKTDVPSGALFTDTIYDDTALKTRITAVENREDKDTTYTAGANVQISTGNKISATDTKYTAGDNITITDNKISAVDTKYTHPTSHPASMITETTDKKFMTSAEKNKLDGIATNANYYTHPTSHPASMITESTTKRFVSDAEKTTWNGKQDKLTAGTNVSISGTTISATDTKYTAGTNVSISGTTISATDTTYEVATTSANGLMSSADKTKLNGIESGAQKNTVTSVAGKTGAVTVTKSDVGLGSVNNVAITAAQVTKINQLNYTKALTQAQYDALSTTEKNRTDVWYGIYK